MPSMALSNLPRAGKVLVALSSASAEEFQFINPDELLKLMESKTDIVVVDTQEKSTYECEHITGAMSLPWAQEIEDPGSLSRYKLLIFYCGCSGGEASQDVARQLVENYGYKSSNIRILQGGILKWLELGYPMDRRKAS